jgi:opacity protein-like surface antigen
MHFKRTKSIQFNRKKLFAFRFPLLAWKRLSAFCLLLFAFHAKVLAQTWEVGGSVGGAAYMGDLNQNHPAKVSGPAAGVFVQRNFNPYLSLKLNYNYGKISGADSTSSLQQFRDRNLSFTTRLNELSLIAEFNLMKYTPGAERDRFTPYIFAGVGAVAYNPQANYLGTDYDLRGLLTEGQAKPYPYNALVVPYGAGIKYNFSDKWNIMINAGYRYVRSDYLDDVSGAYTDKTIMTNPLGAALSDRSGEKTGVYIGTPGSQRGDYRSHDTYLFVGFTLSFTFVTANCYY